MAFTVSVCGTGFARSVAVPQLLPGQLAPVAGEVLKLPNILKSRLWSYLRNFALHEFQTTMFQPVGGMDMIGKAFARQVEGLVTHNIKVNAIAPIAHTRMLAHSLNMPEPLLHFLILLPAVYLSVIIHEAGHAVIGKAFGFVVTSLGLGTAGSTTWSGTA